MAEQSITLEPGEAKVVSFEAAPHEVKTYSVSVDGLTGTFCAVEAPLELAVGDLIITSLDGKKFTEVGTELMPYAVLSSPRVVRWITSGTVWRIHWKTAKEICFDEDDKIGIAFWMMFEGKLGGCPISTGSVSIPLYCEAPEGCPPGVRVNCGMFEGVTNLSYGLDDIVKVVGTFDAKFVWEYRHPGGTWGGGSFRIKNVVKM